MAKKETAVETISPVGGNGIFEADNSAFEAADNRALNGSDAEFEDSKPSPSKPAPQPLRRTITPTMTVGERGEPDTYDRAPASAPPAPVKGQHDPALPKSGFVDAPGIIHSNSKEAFLTDEKWVLVRPNATRRCFIGPRIWYFEKDVQLSVPESVKQVLARAAMIYPG